MLQHFSGFVKCFKNSCCISSFSNQAIVRTQQPSGATACDLAAVQGRYLREWKERLGGPWTSVEFTFRWKYELNPRTPEVSLNTYLAQPVS